MNQVETEVRAAGASWRWGAETPAVLERVRAGETSLYEVLVHRYNPRLRCIVRRVLSNEADVEEVLQETHYNAFRFIRQFSGRSSFATWLTRIAIHAALSRLRHRAYLHELSPISSTGEPLETVVSAQSDPEQQLQDKETREALEAAVQALPEPYRAVFFLRNVKELSTAEGAVLLEISEACAKTRLQRARALLCSRLRERWKPLRSTGGCVPTPDG
jgi:RNA polymerase sigma-70 factor (ECF subfamily)